MASDMPFWSPDSQSLGFFQNGKLLKIPVGGGPPETLCEAKNYVGGTWSRDGVVLFGQWNGPVMRVPASGGEPSPVTELEKGKYMGDGFPHFLPDSDHFLYLGLSRTQSASDNALFVGGLDSKQSKFLFKSAAEARFYSPDHLLFVRSSVLMAQLFDTRKLELKGEPVRIADNVAASPGGAAFSTSVNGVLAFRSGGSTWGTSQGTSQLTWYNRDGKNLGLAGPPGTYSEIALSPDEKHVAVNVSTDPNDPLGSLHIWLLDLSNGVFSRLTFDSSPEVDPAWSPDSRQIIYGLEKTGRPEITRLTLGSTEPQKVYSDGIAAWVDDWSPDGRYLAYHDGNGTAFFALPLAGPAKPLTLVSDSYAKDQLHFSPDGKWVVYNSEESGQSEVYIAAFPKMDQKRQVSTDGGAQPMWRKDGKELFYLSRDGKMMAVTVTEAATLETGPPKVLFQTGLDGANDQSGVYAVAANGQKFLLLDPVKTQEAKPIESIHVIVNWDAALAK